ncbi:NADP-dependent oxidoreductase [Actinomadura montaniterrae]|uniref:NADP-dependent oxidoreductase n=1 Tax=Actinomadura montaniterrae TaxID=1803903 RepID=UPI001CEF9F1D|nr:NADP-dependent oxidoreductase [Actinomadura montaniterrae]
MLGVEDVEPRPLGPRDVLVRVRAAGINRGEVKIRTGALHERFPATFPSGQGSDLAGTVTATGAAVTGWAPGDPVLGWSWERSSHAEYVVVPHDQLVRKPDGLPWAAAGALYVAGSTAWAAVTAVDPRAGKTVVVSGATGGVGTIAVQLLRLRRAHVIAIASPRHRDWLESQGATPVHYGSGVTERLRRTIEGDGTGTAHAFLDFHGGDYPRTALSLGVPPRRVNTLDYGNTTTLWARSSSSQTPSPTAPRAATLELSPGEPGSGEGGSGERPPASGGPAAVSAGFFRTCLQPSCSAEVDHGCGSRSSRVGHTGR